MAERFAENSGGADALASHFGGLPSSCAFDVEMRRPSSYEERLSINAGVSAGLLLHFEECEKQGVAMQCGELAEAITMSCVRRY